MAAQVPAPFALAPALAGGGQPIDYSSRAGQTLYSQATADLPYTFEGKTSSLPAFLQAIRDRSDSAGWDDIFTITVNNDDKNLLTQYGEISLQDVRANAVVDYIGLQNRNAQILHQIYQCLRKSVSTEVNDRLVTESTNFYIGETPDGPSSFLMTLINVYFVKTNATATTIRLKIADAHLLIAEHQYNFDAFNAELNSHIQKLAASGETTEDLFAHLTKAYKLVPDKEFQRYIRERIDAHNDGTTVLTTTQLMDRAKTKYDALVEGGAWMAKDDTEQQLVVLTNQLQQVQDKNKELQRQFKKGPSASKRSTSKKGTSDTKSEDDKWAWKTQKPRSNQATKTFEGKTYHWCSHHEKWTLHKPDECRLKRETQSDNPSPNDPSSLSAILSDPDDNGALSQE